MEYKFVKQKNYSDCGIAISTMIINYLQKKNLTIEQIKFDNNIPEGELSFYNIESLLTTYKIQFKSYFCNIKDFLEIKIVEPLIIKIKNKDLEDHFIVVYKKNKKSFLIADPIENDLKEISIEEFIKLYDGYFGVAKKLDNIKFKNNCLSNVFTLFFTKINIIIYYFILSIFLNCIILITSSFLKVFSFNVAIDDINNQKLIFFGFALLFLFQIILNYIMSKILLVLKNDIAKKIVEIYIDKILKMDIEKYQTLSKEEWIKKIAYINKVISLTAQIFLVLPTQSVLFILALSIIGYMSKTILFLLLVENVLSVFFSYVFNLWIKDKKIKSTNDDLKFSVLFREIIEANFEIKTKSLQNHFERKFLNSYQTNIQNDNDIFRVESLNSFLLSVVSKFFYILIFYISSLLITKQELTFTQLLFYVTTSTYIYGFTSLVFNFTLSKEDNKIAIKQINFLFEKTLKKEVKLNLEKINSIECKKVYKYKNETKVISDINYKFMTNTFIFGKSGSGKTSLLQLFSGNINNYEGELFFNDIEFKKINPNSLKEKILYIGQYDFLFTGSVWANIQQFQNQIDLELFKKYQLFEILANNNIDINKRVIENGANLSKGQRQIINFISTFFTKKDLYLIDEPLSNVDRNTAYYLLDTFLKIKKNSLVIMTDHNPLYQNFFENRMEI
ncbi:bacteriocin ABC transporter [Spiroplasma gladiatoris]|uniref:Bacteriocin ABC transporter n=1 Tax=Spiroplasma gladiatoris TaxID=2143 RepID=A0A4P7AHI2_9MOLU|nr:cysteine peptidase family C39 domain-containing protein [Spiroplasma gladiatoris]QBQ07905.1 bacteriocin ABC transporter [Spiroplasma gladiatoris]